MATIKINPPKAPQIVKAPALKLPMGRAASGSTQFRSSSSGYGKLQKLPGGSPGVMVPKVKD